MDEPMNMFAGIKKKKKKVTVAELEVEDEAPSSSSGAGAAGAGDVDPVRPLEDSADLTVRDDETLDFSDLKKKKKKKQVALDLDDVASPDANLDKLGNTKEADATEAPAPEAAAATSEDPVEEFAGLKKKKKSKKTAFDLEAFEKELAAVEEGDGAEAAGDSTLVLKGSDDEADIPAPEGENPFGDAGGEGADGKSNAEAIAEKKRWLSEPDRDYTYTELLGRFYSLLFSSHPSLSRGGGKKRYTIPPPNVQREGSKRSLFVNIEDICKRMHRTPEHVIQFLFSELGTSGSVDGSKRLVIKGRFQQKQIENVLRRYIVEYVTCKTCKSPDTLLSKDNRIFFVTCETCGSKQSVSSIKVGFQAQTKRRPKAA